MEKTVQPSGRLTQVRPNESGKNQPGTYRASPHDLATLQRYSTVESLMYSNPPVLQEKCLANEARAVVSTLSPRMALLAEKLSVQTLQDWLSLQIEAAFLACGFQIAGERDAVVRSVAGAVLFRYGHYKLSEIALFLGKYKNGDYGVHSSVFNQQKFMEALSKFNKYRLQVLAQEEGRALQQEREEWKRQAVPPPEGMDLDKLLMPGKKI